MIPIFEPTIFKNSVKYVNQALKTGWISSQGNFIKKFEKKLAKFHNLKYCLLTSSCTSALHLSILSLDLKKNDEIICPALSFIAPSNMVVLSNLKLVLVDIDKDTLNIDVKKIEKKITKKTKAILVVHQFGHSADMEKIIKLKKKYNLKIIEDNAESFGGKYKGKLNGTMGDITTLSFFANKIITTGEGGAILTNNKSLYLKCLEMRDHGMSLKKKYLHTRLGFNYRMTNLQAAVGLSQIEKISYILSKRNKQMSDYYSLLNKNKNFKLRSFKNWCTPVHWLLTITLNTANLRDKMLTYLKRKNIDARQMINPINDAPHIKKKIKEKFPISRKISYNSLHLPSGLNLKNNQIKYVVKCLNNFFKDVNIS